MNNNIDNDICNNIDNIRNNIDNIRNNIDNICNNNDNICNNSDIGLRKTTTASKSRKKGIWAKI